MKVIMQCLVIIIFIFSYLKNCSNNQLSTNSTFEREIDMENEEHTNFETDTISETSEESSPINLNLPISRTVDNNVLPLKVLFEGEKKICFGKNKQGELNVDFKSNGNNQITVQFVLKVPKTENRLLTEVDCLFDYSVYFTNFY